MARTRYILLLSLVILISSLGWVNAASKPPVNNTYGEGVLGFKLTLPAGWSVSSDKPGFTQFMSTKGSFCWVQRSKMQQMKPADIIDFYKDQGYKVIDDRHSTSLSGTPGGRFSLVRSESGVEWRYDVTDVYKDGIQWLIFSVAAKDAFSKGTKDFQSIYKGFNFIKPEIKPSTSLTAPKAKDTQPLKTVAPKAVAKKPAPAGVSTTPKAASAGKVKSSLPASAQKATANNTVKPAANPPVLKSAAPVYSNGGADLSRTSKAVGEAAKPLSTPVQAPVYEYLKSDGTVKEAPIDTTGIASKISGGDNDSSTTSTSLSSSLGSTKEAKPGEPKDKAVPVAQAAEQNAEGSGSRPKAEATITPVAEIKPLDSNISATAEGITASEVKGLVKVDIAEIKAGTSLTSPTVKTGRLAYVKSGEVWVRDLKTSADRLIGKGSNPRLSFQGRHLLFEEPSGTWVLVDLDGLNRNKLPLNLSADNAGLSRDGSRIAYQVTKRFLGGSSSVSSYISDMNGKVIRDLKGFGRSNSEETGRIIEYIGSNTQYKDPFFTSQPNKVFLSAKMGSSWSIAVADLNDNTIKIVVTGGERPVVSSDNKWVLYTRRVDKYNRLWLCGVDGKSHKELGVEADNYTFTPDSKSVIYEWSGSLYKVDVDTGAKSLYLQGATCPSASGSI